MTEELPRDKHPDDEQPDDEHPPGETPPEERGALRPHSELPPYWSELFKNIPKIDLPRMPKIDLPRVPKIDIPYVPKIEVPRFDVSSALAEEIARISDQARAVLASVASPIEQFTVQLPRIPTVPQHVVSEPARSPMTRINS